VQAQVRARIIRQRTTKEGEYLDFCQDELTLKIDNCNDRLMLMWPTLVTHKIDEESPLYEFTKQDMQNEHYEIIIMLEGGVESTGLATQARTSYLPSEILWGHRFRSTISYNDKNEEFEVKIHKKFYKLSIQKVLKCFQANFDLIHMTYKVDTPECSAKELKEGKSSKHEPRQNLLAPNGVNNSFINSS
jgi:potassium inwardly-rectifying channel subfamily J